MARGRSYEVLVVDDSPGMRQQLVGLLEQAGARTVEAADGAKAWKALQGAKFDLLVTDIHMPVMDGLKLIHLVRTGRPEPRLPIIVVTAETADKDRRRAMALGADHYLVKPVDGQELIESCEQLLHLPPED